MSTAACALSDFVFSYSSVRYVTIHAKCPGAVYRLLQIVVLLYIGLSIVFQKTYQGYEPVLAVPYIKLKGVAKQNGSVVDTADLVVPPQLQSARFITTHMEEQKEIQDGKCPASDPFNCVNDKCPFPVGSPALDFGFTTGACQAGYCQVQGWCPVADTNKTFQFQGIGDFSLFVRLNYQFPAFGITMDSAENGKVPGVNLWNISEVLRRAGCNYEEIRSKGVVIMMSASFDCDVNNGHEDCKPTWDFTRLDNPNSKSTGYNYYEILEYAPNAGMHAANGRTVNKRYGIKLELRVLGKAGKFSLVQCIIAVGSGLAFLSVASLVTDFILQNFWIGKEHFQHHKYQVPIELQNESLLSPRAQPPVLRREDSQGVEGDERPYTNIEEDARRGQSGTGPPV